MNSINSRGIHMVVTDMDKTLLNDEGHISERNIEAIKGLKSRDIKFAIATGRSKNALFRLLSRYDINDCIDYVICMNGVSIFDARENKAYDFGYLDNGIIGEIYEKLKHYDISFAVHEGDKLLCTKRTKYTDIESDINGYGVIETNEFIQVPGKKYPKLMLIGESDVLEDVQNTLAEDKTDTFNYFRAYDFFVEIVSRGVSKGNALVKLCELKGIDLSKVLAIGDNLNDLDMIKKSGFGVAVENCHEELKKYAKFLSKSNNDDGFAYACDMLIYNLSYKSTIRQEISITQC